MFESLFEVSTFIPKINSVSERVKEVTFSLLNHFITSRKNDWLQLQLWKV